MGIYVYVQRIHFVIQQKLTQHCKAIIFQQRCLKKNKKHQKWLPYLLPAITKNNQIKTGNHFITTLFIYLFIFGCIGSSLLHACFLWLLASSGGYSSLRCAGFSLQWLLLLRIKVSRHAGFSSCSTWAQQLWLMGSRAQAQQLWRTGLVALRHVGSSRTRARTHVPCISRRQILNHCATREAPITTLNGV